VTRFVNDILLSAPSIVIGLFVYAVVVARFKQLLRLGRRTGAGADRDPGRDPHHREHAAAGAAGLREAAYALGAPKWKVILSITLRAARAGRRHRRAAGRGPHLRRDRAAALHGAEQPVLDLRPDQPMASLPVTIFKFAMSPYENWQQLAWAGVFLITVAVLGLNILARVLTRNKT
jgi:phosphate transport system permease protein